MSNELRSAMAEHLPPGTLFLWETASGVGYKCNTCACVFTPRNKLSMDKCTWCTTRKKVGISTDGRARKFRHTGGFTDDTVYLEFSSGGSVHRVTKVHGVTQTRRLLRPTSYTLEEALFFVERGIWEEQINGVWCRPDSVQR